MAVATKKCLVSINSNTIIFDFYSKRTNWKSVPASKLTKEAFWTQVDEERMASDSLINNLINKFGTKPVAKQIENSESVQNGVNKKKTKELKVLDPKAAQNLSILLGKI